MIALHGAGDADRPLHRGRHQFDAHRGHLNEWISLFGDKGRMRRHMDEPGVGHHLLIVDEMKHRVHHLVAQIGGADPRGSPPANRRGVSTPIGAATTWYELHRWGQLVVPNDMVESHDKPYVLCVRGNERLMMGDFRTHTAEALAADLSAEAWRRLPAGQGSKGPRHYDWARVRPFRLQSPPRDHWLLIRRSISDPADMAFYVTFAPDVTPLAELAGVAGLRWTIEECFQSAKGETGLAHCESRSGYGWHRPMTLSMLALAFLAGLRARLKEAQIEAASGKANKRNLSAA